MVNTITLDHVYDTTPRNLDCFGSLSDGVQFRFLTDREMIEQARRIIQRIEQKKPDVIVYSDTGVWPLVYICQTLIKISRVSTVLKDTAWVPIKCPRESVGKYENVILSLLTSKERSKRETEIRQHARDLNTLFIGTPSAPLGTVFRALKKTSRVHACYEKVLAGTQFSRLCASTIVYLDEYIDSGVTLSNTFNVLKCFNQKVQAHIVAYYTFAFRKDMKDHSVVSLYSKDDGVQAFASGAYPYENRLDIIGTLYVNTDTDLRKVDMLRWGSELKKDRAHADKISQFLSSCLECISSKKLGAFVNEWCSLKELDKSGVIDDLEVLRYLLYFFAVNANSDKTRVTLLWNLFDMFGPAWSPLPDKYHIDFWNSFSLLKKELVTMPEVKKLQERYTGLETQIVREVVRICGKRHTQWKRDICNIIRSNQTL